jgi:uracil-DNA glycosylase
MTDKERVFSELEKNIRICKKCRLHGLAKNPVPGEGSLSAELAFIGEAPGQTEDETGRPFVGRAGMLLEKMLSKIGLKRSDVWIGNVIKHRPPENRDPLPDEISACMPYLTLQLKTMKPVLVVTLGRYSMGYFVQDGKISRDHGCVIKTPEFNVYPIYHPAAALRNPTMMKDFVEDFMRIPTVLAKTKAPVEVKVSVPVTGKKHDSQLKLEL